MRAIVLALVLAACGGHAAPAPAPKHEPTALEKSLDAYIESYGRNWGDRHRMSGFVMVSQHDETLYARGFGFADRDAKAVPDADTSFRIGSLTKQFTATAILMLQQDGKLKTSDTIATYLPDYPAAGAAITLHQLLTHTSGIPNYTDDAALMEARDRPITVAALIATFADKPLRFEPGTRFEYSNSNYVLLGAIIEKVSGMSYADFMRTRIFTPAGMSRTVVGDATGMDDRAIGYTFAKGAVVPAPAIDMSVPFAAGAIRSTATDLVRWHRALEGDGLLTAASKQEMYTPELADYAYGWFIHDIEGHRAFDHGGGIDGFVSHIMRIEDLDLVVVALSNYENIEIGHISRAAVDAVLGHPLEPVDEPARVDLDPAVAAGQVGSWTLSEESKQAMVDAGIPQEVIDSVLTVEVTIADDELVFKPVGQDAIPLVTTSATEYIRPEIGVTVTFTADTMTLAQAGLTLTYARAQ